MKKLILFTGGGSAGHVTPNIALIKRVQSLGFEVCYAGSEDGIEKRLIEPLNIPYYAIDSGKLRREHEYILNNLLSPFKVLHGVWQSYQLLKKLRPNIVFSKGGFVAVPVVAGAWLNHIPIIAHESDLTPGLANKLCYPFVKKIALGFPQSEKFFKAKSKIVYTGTPIRDAVLQGDANKGKQFLNFTDNKPILLIYGGGLGSLTINLAIRKILPALLKQFNVAHCCGKGKCDSAFDNIQGYRQFEYLQNELPDVMAASDCVISRAGANSIYELLILHKPHLLIPLSKKASRGDQIDNANYYANLGLSRVLPEEQLSSESLLQAIESLWAQRETIKKTLEAYPLPDATTKIVNLIQEYMK